MAKKQSAPKPVAAPRPQWQSEIAAQSLAVANATLSRAVPAGSGVPR